jgi:hypothetical protein
MREDRNNPGLIYLGWHGSYADAPILAVIKTLLAVDLSPLKTARFECENETPECEGRER